MPKVSIIIINYNTCALTTNCLRSIARFAPRIPIEIIVVDNASADNSLTSIPREFPDVRLAVNESNLGFAAANNRGIQMASGHYILLLNSDSLLTEGALNRLLDFMETHQEVAAAAPCLLNEDGSFQRSFFQFPNAAKVFLHILEVGPNWSGFLRSIIFKFPWLRYHKIGAYLQDSKLTNPLPVPYVLFACILFRREVFSLVGLMDEKMFFYHEDCEFGFRMAKRGLQIWWVPTSRVIHLGGGTSCNAPELALKSYFSSLIYLFRKHKSLNHFWILKITIGLGFFIRSFLTLFGAYSVLEIPSTYKIDVKKKRHSFGNPLRRTKYYFNLALFALKQ